MICSFKSLASPTTTITNVLIGIVAALHFRVGDVPVNTPVRPSRVWLHAAEFSKASKVLASNQGLYNGFLAAGLIWSLLDPHSHAFELKIFFDLRDCGWRGTAD